MLAYHFALVKGQEGYFGAPGRSALLGLNRVVKYEITFPRPTGYRFGFTDPCDAANTLRARSASERLP